LILEIGTADLNLKKIKASLSKLKIQMQLQCQSCPKESVNMETQDNNPKFKRKHSKKSLSFDFLHQSIKYKIK
jgi:hypothetical protein